ncbi:hypothetical protein GGQ92_001773 [Gracilibacillus halotolerans]|uniref:SLAP domain-containing protein n=1 Tax=Gracilibacillus halotolerans TaxID=74386 RepID=A0A841RPY0_9BACI|nr:hypothetical protein [Gracilibacillus halotolerans]MBB6512984.1 hypothetical protein [Gracilibacillus halotolerans]
MEKIELILPKAHQKVQITPAMQREMDDVQRELLDKGNRLDEGKIHVIISKGFYKHDKKMMTIATVIVNKTNQDINTLKMTLKFGLRDNVKAQFAPMNAMLDEEFLGLLKNNQAFILHINVPVKDVGEGDHVFEPRDIVGQIDNVEYFIQH